MRVYVLKVSNTHELISILVMYAINHSIEVELHKVLYHLAFFYQVEQLQISISFVITYSILIINNNNKDCIKLFNVIYKYFNFLIIKSISDNDKCKPTHSYSLLCSKLTWT